MNTYLKKFNTHDQYKNSIYTLDNPNVSYDNSHVHFNGIPKIVAYFDIKTAGSYAITKLAYNEDVTTTGDPLSLYYDRIIVNGQELDLTEATVEDDLGTYSMNLPEGETVITYYPKKYLSQSSLYVFAEDLHVETYKIEAYNCNYIQKAESQIGQENFPFTLKEVYLYNSMGVFRGCQNLIKVKIIDSHEIKNQQFFYCNIASIEIPNTVEKIGYSAFDSNSSLEEITIPESVKEIGYFAFRNTGIKNMVIPNSVTSLSEESNYHYGGHFSYTGNLESITFGTGITHIPNTCCMQTFDNCSLQFVHMKSSTPPTIGEHVFYQYDNYHDPQYAIPSNLKIFVPVDSVQAYKTAWPEYANYIFAEPEYVDLGLPSGTLWAKWNIGATSETDYGLYFQWGDTQGYTASQVGSEEGKKAFTWDDYKYGTDSNLTKYNTSDGLTTLELSDDAASINWGSDWKTPTKAQFDELMINTEWYLVNSDGTIVSSGTGGGVDEELINYDITVNGTWFVNNKSDIGDLTKGLFLPACGYAGYYSVSSIGQSGAYLSSSLVETNQKFFYDLEFSANFATAVTLAFRSGGNSIRGVLNQ